MKAQIGHGLKASSACRAAILMRSPKTALPNGHWSARGLKFWGRVGGLEGFGMSCSHPVRHDFGIQGGFLLHQLVKVACSIGAMASAMEFQTIPGAHGAAVAFCEGIFRKAAARSCTVKGTPGASSQVKGVRRGPLQVSLT